MPLPSIGSSKRKGIVVTAPYGLDYTSTSTSQHEVDNNTSRLNPGVSLRMNILGRPVLVKQPRKPQGLAHFVHGYEGNPNNINDPTHQTLSLSTNVSNHQQQRSSVTDNSTNSTLLPKIRMTPNVITIQITRTPQREAKTPTEGEMNPRSSLRHLSELHLTQTKKEECSENLRKLQQNNASLHKQMKLLENEHLIALAATGHHDAEFTGDGTSLDTYVKELSFYKRFAGPASTRTQYMKFKG
jgi:hypothetical protein